MAEAKKTEYEDVTMTDGRVVKFAGKQKMKKEHIIDAGAFTLDGDTLMVSPGAVSIRLDFRNGETRTYPLPVGGDAGILKFAGHGGEQKFGDNLASKADDPMSLDDMVQNSDDLAADIASGVWSKGRAEGGGGIAGASIVVMALMEKYSKTREFIMDFVEKRLATLKAQGQETTRAALYAGYRASDALAPIITRLEAEKKAKEAAKAKIDVSEDLAALAE